MAGEEKEFEGDEVEEEAEKEENYNEEKKRSGAKEGEA